MPSFDRPSSPRVGRQQKSSGTYIAKDPNSRKELERIRIQSEMVTEVMGGPLSEQQDPTIFKRVIDVGCGVGDWLFKLAETYPTMTTLVGIDINKMMVNKAKAIAATLPGKERLEFKVLDAMQELPFPDASFDLVNMRCRDKVISLILRRTVNGCWYEQRKGSRRNLPAMVHCKQEFRD